MKVLSIYVLITFLRNLIGLIYNFLLVRYEYQANTVFYYNVHNIIGFYLIAYLYFILLKSIFWRNIILGLTAFFSFFTTLDVINGTLGINTPEFNKYSYPISGIFITFLALAHLYKILKELQTDNILTFSHFWISASFLLYFSCTFYMYLFVKNTLNVKGIDALQFWLIDSIFSIIFSLLLSIVFIYSKNSTVVNSK